GIVGEIFDEHQATHAPHVIVRDPDVDLVQLGVGGRDLQRRAGERLIELLRVLARSGKGKRRARQRQECGRDGRENLSSFHCCLPAVRVSSLWVSWLSKSTRPE